DARDEGPEELRAASVPPIGVPPPREGSPTQEIGGEERGRDGRGGLLGEDREREEGARSQDAEKARPGRVLAPTGQDDEGPEGEQRRQDLLEAVRRGDGFTVHRVDRAQRARGEGASRQREARGEEAAERS